MKKILVNFTNRIKEIPVFLSIIFVVCLVMMNIMSNKTIYQSKYLAIDGGFLISWLPFLIIDLITIHLGTKHAFSLTILGIIINVVVALVFYLTSLIPTSTNYEALNQLLGGTWFILLSSSIALLVSSYIDIFINYSLRKLTNKIKNEKAVFLLRTSISTFIGQSIDNLIFSTLTFMVFAPIFWNGFSWTFIQCLTSSLLFALIELAMQLIFTPFAYKISAYWKAKQI